MATTTWNRGREANKPTEIPWKGWKDILMRVKEEVGNDRISLVSAGLAYYALFSLVPAISSIVLIYAWVSDPNEITNHISVFSNQLPKEVESIITSQLSGLAGRASSSLGFGAILSLFISLWSASKGSKAIMEAMNIIYEETETRGLIKKTALALGMTLFAAVLSIIAIGVIIVLPTVVAFFNLGGFFQTLTTLGSWIILLGLFSVFLSFAYRYGPNRNQAQWKWVSWGAVVAAVLWAGASLLFTWYVSNFGSFNKTYGSLAAVVILMMWFYISSFVILLGGEINAEIEHQTKKDSTKGEPKPMGQRNAQMADTMGKAYQKKNS
jgi:membrane protein